jgi:hypothetical protein
MTLHSQLHHWLDLLERVAGPKRRFVVFGALNVVLTNLLLQLLLLSQSIWSATLLSQAFNTCVGFYLYGKGVFRVSRLRIRSLCLYGMLAVFLWVANAAGIEWMGGWGVQANMAAMLMVPLLAGLSYTCQKYLVFH